jgi:hypothetical protein
MDDIDLINCIVYKYENRNYVYQLCPRIDQLPKIGFIIIRESLGQVAHLYHHRLAMLVALIL